MLKKISDLMCNRGSRFSQIKNRQRQLHLEFLGLLNNNFSQISILITKVQYIPGTQNKKTTYNFRKTKKDKTFVKNFNKKGLTELCK